MRGLIILVLTVISPLCIAAEFTGLAPEVWVGKVDKEGVHSFKGLPFAAPPIGENRWRSPQPYQPQSGRKEADQFAAACMQIPHIENWYRELIKSLGEDPTQFKRPARGYSEDCLFLNIWSRDLSEDALKPVMVWVHGGSNKGGWSYEPNYHGEELASHDVVLVSVPYRLGIFSYFSHPELLAEQDGMAGNYALLDLIAALRWIKEHITSFGGDPDNITLFGESTGAENIAHLMAAPEAQGLFHKVIHQSGPGLSKQSLTGLTSYGLEVSGNQTLDELRTISASEMLEIQERQPPADGFTSVAGGHGLPGDDTNKSIYSSVSPVPLMIGTNANEWLMYIDGAMDQYIADYQLEANRDAINGLLPGLDPVPMLDRFVTAVEMLCPSLKLANLTTRTSPGYVYLFSKVRPGSFSQKVGAYHGAEIPYVFDTHDSWLNTSAEDLALTRMMQRYWVNFARSGNPNESGLPAWNNYTAENPIAMNLDVTLSMTKARDVELCKLIAQ
jgi:para-nitrobenzyl esterase